MAKVTPKEERSDRYTKRQLKAMDDAEIDDFVAQSVDTIMDAADKFSGAAGDEATEVQKYKDRVKDNVAKAQDESNPDYILIEIGDDKDDTEIVVLAVVYERVSGDHWQAIELMIKNDLDGSKAFAFTKPMIKTFNMEIRKAGIKRVTVRCPLGGGTDLLMDKLVTHDKTGSIAYANKGNYLYYTDWEFDYHPLTDAELAAELADDEAKKLDKEAKKPK